jgi:hypothetical protein
MRTREYRISNIEQGITNIEVFEAVTDGLFYVVNFNPSFRAAAMNLAFSEASMAVWYILFEVACGFTNPYSHP